MVGGRERGTNWIYPYEKNNILTYKLLSDKQYLYPPEFVPLLSNTQKTVYDSDGNTYFPLPL